MDIDDAWGAGAGSGERYRLAVIGQEGTPIPRVKGGSVALVLDELIKRLKHRFDVRAFSIVDPLCPRSEEREGVRYVRFATTVDRRVIQRAYRWYCRATGRSPHLYHDTGAYFIAHMLRVGLALRRFRPDVVLVNNLPQHGALLKRINPSSKVVLFMHCRWLSDMDFARTDRCLRDIDLVLVCGGPTAEAARERFPHYSDKIVAITNGVDHRRFTDVPAASVEAIKKELGIKPVDKVLLSLGRITPEKGVHTLLLALPIVLQRFPDAKLVVTGPNWLTPRHPVPKPELGNVDELKVNYEEWLKTLAAPWGDRVVFAGEILMDRVPATYKAADLFVFPSFEEASPLPVLEAMAAGRPVAASAVGGILDFILPDRGWLFPHNDPRALASVLIEALSCNRLEVQTMVTANMEAVKYRFTWDRQAEIFYDYLMALIENRPHEHKSIESEEIPAA